MCFTDSIELIKLTVYNGSVADAARSLQQAPNIEGVRATSFEKLREN